MRILVGLILAGLLFFGSQGLEAEKKSKVYQKRKIQDIIEHYNNVNYSRKIANEIIKMNLVYEVSPITLLAIIQVESNFNKSEIGSSGEVGLMQITEIAWQELKNQDKIAFSFVEIGQISKNIRAGTLYYLYCLKRANGNRRKALAYYNGGFNSPNYEYANKVLRTFRQIEGMI